MQTNNESINAFLKHILQSAYEENAYQIRFEKGNKAVIAIVCTKIGTTRHFYRGDDSVWLVLSKFLRFCHKGILRIFRKNGQDKTFKLTYDSKGLTLTRL